VLVAAMFDNTIDSVFSAFAPHVWAALERPGTAASWRDAIPSGLYEKRWWNDTSSSVGAQLQQ
jgi:hypothetical protein